MMVGYAFHVRLLHSLLFAGFYRRFPNVPESPLFNLQNGVKERGLDLAIWLTGWWQSEPGPTSKD